MMIIAGLSSCAEVKSGVVAMDPFFHDPVSIKLTLDQRRLAFAVALPTER